MGIISGKSAVISLVLEVPPGMSKEEAATLIASVCVSMPITRLLRGSFVEVKDEEAGAVVQRYAERLRIGMRPTLDPGRQD